MAGLKGTTSLEQSIDLQVYNLLLTIDLLEFVVTTHISIDLRELGNEFHLVLKSLKQISSAARQLPATTRNRMPYIPWSLLRNLDVLLIEQGLGENRSATLALIKNRILPISELLRPVVDLS